MSLETSDTCMFLPTTKDICQAIKQTYSKEEDATRVCAVKIKVGAAKQGSRSFSKFANHFWNLCHKLDHYKVLESRSKEEAFFLKNFIKKDRE